MFFSGTLLQESGRLDEAVSCYENAVHFREQLAVAHLNLGLTLQALGKLAAAEKVICI